MAARSRARYLAPLALAAVIAAGYVIVHNGLTHKSKPHASQQSGRPGRGRRHHPPPKFYTVKPGDSLTTISKATGVPIPTIESLNPNLNPNALRPGQQLRLRQ